MASVLRLRSISDPTLGESGAGSVTLTLASIVAGSSVIGPDTDLDYAGLPAASGNWNLVVGNAAGNAFAKVDVSATVRSLLSAADGAGLRAVLGTGTSDNTTYLRGDGTWVAKSSITTTDASLLTSGTLADARLSSNVAMRNAANTFTVGGQVIQTAAGTVGLSVDQAASPTADAFRVRVNSVVGAAFRFNSTGGSDASPLRLVFDDPAGGGSGGSLGWTANYGSITARNPANSSYVPIRAATFYTNNGVYLDTSGIFAANEWWLIQSGFWSADRVLTFNSANGMSWTTTSAANGTTDITLSRSAAGRFRMFGANGSDVGIVLSALSSTPAERKQTSVVSSWATSTDATRQGKLSLGVYGIVSAAETLQTGLTLTARSVPASALVVLGPTTAGLQVDCDSNYVTISSSYSGAAGAYLQITPAGNLGLRNAAGDSISFDIYGCVVNNIVSSNVLRATYSSDPTNFQPKAGHAFITATTPITIKQLNNNWQYYATLDLYTFGNTITFKHDDGSVGSTQSRFWCVGGVDLVAPANSVVRVIYDPVIDYKRIYLLA